jgi:hypothetical protein
VKPVLKVYGHIYPVSEDFFAGLSRVCAQALPNDACALARDGDMALIAFEGVYFPVDDVLEALARHLGPEHKGRLDVLDLENWRLTRHAIDEGQVRARSAPLNNVLEYSR